MAKQVNRLALKKQYLDQQTSNQKIFIADLSFTVNAMFTKNKKDPDICKIKDGFSIVKNETPELVLKRAGPYLWKYRNQIGSRDDKFFLNSDFKDDIASVSESGIPEMTEFSDFPAMIQKLKHTWHLFTVPEKTHLWEKIANMLSQYAGYLQAEKELEKLK
jgi:hypothetical protein